jgi:hypothetical protein
MSNNDTNISTASVVFGYDIERLLFIIGSAILFILSSLQLSVHCRSIYSNSPKPWPSFCGSSLRLSPTTMMTTTTPTAAAAVAMAVADGNGNGIIIQQQQSSSTYTIPLLKGQLHVISFICSICMVIMSFDPSLVFGIYHSVLVTYCTRIIEALVLQGWGLWYLAIVSIRYRDLGKPLPSYLSPLIRLVTIVLLIGSIVSPTLVIITGWQLWIGLLIAISAVIYVLMIITSIIACWTLQKTLDALHIRTKAAAAAAPPQILGSSLSLLSSIALQTQPGGGSSALAGTSSISVRHHRRQSTLGTHQSRGGGGWTNDITSTPSNAGLLKDNDTVASSNSDKIKTPSSRYLLNDTTAVPAVVTTAATSSSSVPVLPPPASLPATSSSSGIPVIVRTNSNGNGTMSSSHMNALTRSYSQRRITRQGTQATLMTNSQGHNPAMLLAAMRRLWIALIFVVLILIVITYTEIDTAIVRFGSPMSPLPYGNPLTWKFSFAYLSIFVALYVVIWYAWTDWSPKQKAPIIISPAPPLPRVPSYG